MIEKPDISDEKIIIALNESYSIQASRVEFLPIGNDSSAFAYRVQAQNGDSYFLKVRKNLASYTGLVIPRFLKDSGVEQVVAPLPAKSQKLHVEMDEFSIILYPFITGTEAMEVGMTDSQWTEFGSILKQIHATLPAENLLPSIERESFIPKWGAVVKAFHEKITTQAFDDPYQRQLALFWQEKNETIQTLVERTEWIGQRLQQVDVDFVLCHADIHTANILITPEQQLFIVDWDGALLAPKERDLMFVVGAKTKKEENLFFEGYGYPSMNLLAMAYYRYEWCVQEIGDYGERVFLKTDAGENTKRQSVEKFMELFEPGDVVATALNTPADI